MSCAFVKVMLDDGISVTQTTATRSSSKRTRSIMKFYTDFPKKDLCEEFDRLVSEHKSLPYSEFNSDDMYKRLLNEVIHLDMIRQLYTFLNFIMASRTSFTVIFCVSHAKLSFRS